MAGRRSCSPSSWCAAVLHAISIARSLLPAQDGLKFIAVARQFQQDPWPDVVRDTDQHPLYPALIAAFEPAVRCLPDPVRTPGESPPRLSRHSPRWRCCAALRPDAVALRRPHRVHRGGDLRPLAGARGGRPRHAQRQPRLAASSRFPAVRGRCAPDRPVAARAFLRASPADSVTWHGPRSSWRRWPCAWSWMIVQLRRGKPRLAVASPVVAAISVSALVLVGGYALVKGQVSEKLALRHGTGHRRQTMSRAVPQIVPRGLDDPRWDFSPKEETDHVPIRQPLKALRVDRLPVVGRALLGFRDHGDLGAGPPSVHPRPLPRPRAGRSGPGPAHRARGLCRGLSDRALAPCRGLGYLSSRHTLPLVMISVPWAAAGTFVCLRGWAVKLPWSTPHRLDRCVLSMGLVVVTLVVYQLRPGHASRWGHWAAGRWLAEHATAGDVVLDTRGWARFVSGRPATITGTSARRSPTPASRTSSSVTTSSPLSSPGRGP